LESSSKQDRSDLNNSPKLAIEGRTTRVVQGLMESDPAGAKEARKDDAKKPKGGRLHMPALSSWDPVWGMIASAATGHNGGGDDMAAEMCETDLAHGAQPWRRLNRKQPGESKCRCMLA
jgi:hypothetical protein